MDGIQPGLKAGTRPEHAREFALLFPFWKVLRTSWAVTRRVAKERFFMIQRLNTTLFVFVWVFMYVGDHFYKCWFWRSLLRLGRVLGKSWTWLNVWHTTRPKMCPTKPSQRVKRLCFVQLEWMTIPFPGSNMTSLNVFKNSKYSHIEARNNVWPFCLEK